jgi:membrane fusion protein (multidrug efflux system)
MPSAFPRTLRSLAGDDFRLGRAGLLIAVLLLAAWLAWFTRAKVPVYEVTDQARVEVDRATHPVDEEVTGRVVAAHLAIGEEVRAGDILVELDAQPQRLQLEEERSRLAALNRQLGALHVELAAEQKALVKASETATATVEEMQAQFRSAEARARLAEEEAKRVAALYASGLVSEVEFLRAKAEAERRRATAESLALAVKRLELDGQKQESDRIVSLERLRGEIARLEGESTTTLATIQRLQEEIERRRIRAPVSGRLAEAVTLRMGAVVREGDRLGAIVPPGKLRVVAEFPPAAALGRIRPGQPARLRLLGFPWTQYGSVRASVSSVASEIRGGRVRVELALLSDPLSSIPFQHGLPGTVEVEVERISPAALVMRTAGGLIATPTPWAHPQDGQEETR